MKAAIAPWGVGARSLGLSLRKAKAGYRTEELKEEVVAQLGLRTWQKLEVIDMNDHGKSFSEIADWLETAVLPRIP